MKIGILTHHYISNFGAFLQTYALQQAVQRMYPDDEVLIINYVNLKHFIINNGGWFRIYKDRETPKSWLEKIKLPVTFHKARRKYLNLSKLCLSVKDVNDLKFDCIIIGSDEVWNYRENKGNAKIKFGCGLDCPNIIAYAPSVGKTDVSEGVPDYVKSGLKKFSAISARDSLTADLAEKITGKRPEIVLDPTFLIKFPVRKKPVMKRPYILFYYCEHLPEETMKNIIEYAKHNNMDIVGAGECNKLYSKITVNLTPFEWVDMFRNAQYVFTGTFHGVVFSILNKKQFACYLTNPSRIKKVGDLLREFEIPDRSTDNQLNIINQNIDYDRVYKHIGEKRKSSLKFLSDNIK